MDFDLFELDDDDEILNSVCLEPTQHEGQLPQTETLTYASDILPEFQCCGDDSLRSQFSTESFIRSGFISQCGQQWSGTATAAAEIGLSAYEFKAAQLHSQQVVQFMFGTACMNIQHLLASVSSPISTSEGLSYYQRRRQVSQLLHLLLRATHHDQWSCLRPQLDSLRRLMNRVTGTDTWKRVYFANSSKGNVCNAPAYHFLHGVLEWKLLDLCILQKYYSSPAVSTPEAPIGDGPASKLLAQLEIVFMDLSICSLYLYSKKRPTELLFSSPFPCTCIKEFWLLLQFAVQKWYSESASPTGEKITFWTLFNRTMAKVKTNMDRYSLTALGLAEFTNWLLHALTRLFGYSSNGHYEGPSHQRASTEEAENYAFCESCAQQFFSAGPSEEQMRVYICLLAPTLLQWWPPKVTIPILLWEHFHKRLNSSFYIAGSAPSNLAVACDSGHSYLVKYRSLLEQLPTDANLSSYTLFVLLLGKSLQRLLLEAHAYHQAQKLLGRIYSKFSLQKFLALNETGIHHLIELFLVLALCGDFDELAPKLSAKLLSIAFDKVPVNRQVAVAKGHVALLILFAERQHDVGEYVTKLVHQLASVRNDLTVSKILADGLLDIFTQASDFGRGEHLLIDTWLPNFLNNCTPSEQDRSLEALHLVFDKLHQNELLTESNMELFKSLNAFVLPFLKQQYVCGFSRWLPQLAADFCTHSSTVSDIHGFQKLFSLFIDAQTASRQSVPQFLLIVLRSDKAALVDAGIIMQVWLKSLVQLTVHNETVAELTKRVVQLPTFRLMTNLDASEVLQAKEPLCVFVAAVGKNYDACANDSRKRCQIADNFNSYLRNFDKWLHPDVKLEKAELAFRFYSFLAIVIYNCPHIVYAKSKITCFFHVAMTRFILPTSVQMGKPPEGRLAQLVHKIWPVLVQGIGRLNFKADPYIGKTLTDIVQKWTPHLKVSPNSKVVARPFIACLQCDNAELSLFMFERLTNMFLATQRRQADPNACLVVTIFQEVVDAVDAATPTDTARTEPDAAVQPAAANADTNERRLETFVKGTSLLMLEHIMMVDEVVPSRALLLDLFRRLFASRTYQRSARLKALLAEHLRILTKKHLAYYTFFCFELLMKLAQLSPELVAHVMDFLLAEVRVVEQKRGAGEDNRIRGCVQKLQLCLEAAKQKSN